MAQRNDENWLRKFEELKEYIGEHGHLPNKKVEEGNRKDLLNYAKYTRKKIKEGTLEEWKKEMFMELMSTRSTEHTGGRRKKSESQ